MKSTLLGFLLGGILSYIMFILLSKIITDGDAKRLIMISTLYLSSLIGGCSGLIISYLKKQGNNK
jgi:predicted PurR-regulated permease PerM